MDGMNVLIVEDEQEISDSIHEYLEVESFICDRAFDFDSAITRLREVNYDCILLDIGMPGGNGLNLLTELRELRKTDGVIIITARDAIDDKVNGLRLGADDYLTKPFHLAELAARVNALIRRKAFDGKNTIVCNNLQIDLKKKTASVNDRVIDFTKKEYELLLYFISNKNKVVSKNAIAEHLWGSHGDLAHNYDFLYTHIKNMRKKLVWAGCEDYVRVVYGTGYKFQQQD